MRVEDGRDYPPYTTPVCGFRVFGLAVGVREEFDDLLAPGSVLDGAQRSLGGCADDVADGNCRSWR